MNYWRQTGGKLEEMAHALIKNSSIIAARKLHPVFIRHNVSLINFVTVEGVIN